MSEEQITFSGGGKSSPELQYGLIWPSALKALVSRFERGIRMKGSGSCNAKNTDVTGPYHDKEFIINRLEHCIAHCYKAIGSILGTTPQLSDEEEKDGGDAGAIMWAGAFLAECLHRHNTVSLFGSGQVHEHDIKVKSIPTPAKVDNGDQPCQPAVGTPHRKPINVTCGKWRGDNERCYIRIHDVLIPLERGFGRVYVEKMTAVLDRVINEK